MGFLKQMKAEQEVKTEKGRTRAANASADKTIADKPDGDKPTTRLKELNVIITQKKKDFIKFLSIRAQFSFFFLSEN